MTAADLEPSGKGPATESTLESVKPPSPFYRKYRHWLLALVTALGLGVFIALLPDYIREALLHALNAQRYLAGLLIVFGLVALSLLWSAGERLDRWVFLYFNARGLRWRLHSLDWLMLIITQIGNGLFALSLALILFLIRDRRPAYEVVLGTLTLWLIVEVIKAAIRRPRPFESLTNIRIVGYREIGRSFPSGHTSQVFFLVTLLAQYYQFAPWAIVTLYILAGVVAVTRMYVGAHYPRDVLAGAMLGSVWGIVGILIDQSFPVGRG